MRSDRELIEATMALIREIEAQKELTDADHHELDRLYASLPPCETYLINRDDLNYATELEALAAGLSHDGLVGAARYLLSLYPGKFQIGRLGGDDIPS